MLWVHTRAQALVNRNIFNSVKYRRIWRTGKLRMHFELSELASHNWRRASDRSIWRSGATSSTNCSVPKILAGSPIAVAAVVVVVVVEVEAAGAFTTIFCWRLVSCAEFGDRDRDRNEYADRILSARTGFKLRTSCDQANCLSFVYRSTECVCVRSGVWRLYRVLSSLSALWSAILAESKWLIVIVSSTWRCLKCTEEYGT